MEKLTLKAIRVQKGLTQHQVSKDTGICIRTLSLWEQGKRSPRIDILKKLLDYYNVSIGDIEL